MSKMRRRSPCDDGPRFGPEDGEHYRLVLVSTKMEAIATRVGRLADDDLLPELIRLLQDPVTSSCADLIHVVLQLAILRAEAYVSFVHVNIFPCAHLTAFTSKAP